MLRADDRAEFESVGTGPVSDAMELLDMRRAVIAGFRYLAPRGRTMAGTATTVRQASKHYPARKAERLVRHGEVAAELAQPGQVIVIDAGGRLDVASWGENHSRRCLSRGVAGLLIDGCVRDAAGIREIGFPVCCRGFSPVKSQWDLETVALDEPVVIGGVQIRVGDMIVADEDGAIVIARDAVAAVLENLRAKSADRT